MSSQALSLDAHFPHTKSPTSNSAYPKSSSPFILSQMICKAIEALKEEGGSSRERISDYIESHNFQDHLHLLPWAHHNLVSYHLQKLVKRGEILALTNNNNNNTYSLIPKTKDDDETEEGGMVMEAKGRRRRPRKNY
ncbi:HMG-Y-related protein A [Senna tora]|uniref:HMG-Y-related protein A n=1 Tax=Senna tora TaxID=362788 RepID=A0A834WMH5_9FABA|nr:HMG-Y-related protein A [Senna tora]